MKAIKKADTGLVKQVGHRTVNPIKEAGNIFNTLLFPSKRRINRVMISPDEMEIANAARVRYGLMTIPKYSIGTHTTAGPYPTEPYTIRKRVSMPPLGLIAKTPCRYEYNRKYADEKKNHISFTRPFRITLLRFVKSGLK